jgi:hypothetical protein
VITVRRYSDYLLIGLLVLASFWLGILVYHNHWGHQAGPTAISATVPEAIHGRTLAGRSQDLKTGSLDQSILLIVLSADCRYCEQNASQWRTLIASLSSAADSTPAVLALSLSKAEDTARYLEVNELEVPVLLINGEELAALGLPGVPGTITLDPGSDTMRSWIGVLSESEAATILTWAMAS